MTICPTCLGTGKVTCPACRGNRDIFRLTVGGDMEQSPCLVCYRTGEVPCEACAGTGRTGEDAASAPATDPLGGRWQAADGGWLEFLGGPTDYAVSAGDSNGPSGSGTASLSGRTVRMDIRYAILGKRSFELMLDAGRLTGNMKIGWFPVHMVFSRR